MTARVSLLEDGWDDLAVADPTHDPDLRQFGLEIGALEGVSDLVEVQLERVVELRGRLPLCSLITLGCDVYFPADSGHGVCCSTDCSDAVIATLDSVFA